MSVQTAVSQFNLITDDDLTPAQAVAIVDRAAQLKAEHHAGQPQHHLLTGKTLAMIFQKPSTRTRVAFEAGMAQLGGHALYLSTNDLQLGRGETIGDTGRVLSRYVDIIMARVYKHDDVVELANSATVPVINGLSDFAHPTQSLADLLTIKERFGGFSGRKLTYVGNTNNMVHSLLLGGALVGLDVCVATPPHCTTDSAVIERAQAIASLTGSTISFVDDPYDGVKNADAIYTDVWVSMGQDVSPETLAMLQTFQVNAKLLSAAAPDAIFMHCLPMHRGMEVTDEVADGPQSAIFDQAENRLHVHKALLVELTGGPTATIFR